MIVQWHLDHFHPLSCQGKTHPIVDLFYQVPLGE